MKTRRIIFSVIATAILGGLIYFNSLLPIITGYAAKNLSSGVFIANRTQESMEATDLNFSFIKNVKNQVDFENKTVTSKYLWHKSKAVLTDGGGCVLVHDFNIDEIKNRPYYKKPALQYNPDTIPWPMGDLIADTVPQGVDIQKLNAALDIAFADTIPHKGTFAVAIAYKGQLIAERYKSGFSDENKFLSWSMAKSFTNAMVGVLEKQGKLDVNEPIQLEPWQNDERKIITVDNLLRMNSGLAWNEDYGNNSNVNIMLHKVGDFGNYAIHKKLENAPGEKWYYSSGTSNIVTYYIRKLFHNDAEYYAFPYQEIFEKLGMHSVVFEVDASGTFVGSSYLYASMRDYTRFGLWYLNHGKWGDTQLLPVNWVNYTLQPAKDSDGNYGAFFWLNNSGKNYPDVPRDMYSCQGHDGQFIYIIPSKDLVVVRTGFSKHGDFDRNAFLSSIVDAFE